MMINRAACLAFTAACLTGIATLPAAHAQTAYGTAPAAALPTGDSGGNSMGMPGPNPGGPGLTRYTGGAPGATPPYPAYPPAPTAAGTSNTEMVTNGPQAYPHSRRDGRRIQCKPQPASRRRADGTARGVGNRAVRS